MGLEEEHKWCIAESIIQHHHLIINLRCSESTIVGGVHDDMKVDVNSYSPVRDTGSFCVITACFVESVAKCGFVVGNFFVGEMLRTAASTTVNERLLRGPGVAVEDERLF